MEYPNLVSYGFINQGHYADLISYKNPDKGFNIVVEIEGSKNSFRVLLTKDVFIGETRASLHLWMMPAKYVNGEFATCLNRALINILEKYDEVKDMAIIVSLDGRLSITK